MRRICLALPTNRPCAEAITALHEEAAYAAERFGAEVHLLVLDSCADAVRAEHAALVRELPRHDNVVKHHLGEAEQRDFLRRAITRSGADKPDLLLDLMLPDGLSYGACTNRAFLIAAALGCASVHRRDSDSRYQRVGGETVYPIHHELATIGRPAREAAAHVTATDLDPRHLDKTVSLVGASFIGEMSVDIAEMERIDPDTYHDVVGLWAPFDWPATRKREFAADSFRGAGTTPFTADRATLTLVDPMRVDMCNIAFHGVHEQVPLLPATDTIGSDYFLIHLVYDATLPGVLHNRDIVNYYTGERRTDAGFAAYHLRFVKFLLSMLYLNVVYDRMAEAGASLLDADGRVRTAAVAELLWESSRLDTGDNVLRLDAVDRAYRRLGGRYALFARSLADRRERLLDEARRAMEDFALLTEVWPALVGAAKATAVRTDAPPC
ncbi:DUF6271 family protein [Actinacidiphila sp. DG2A-62]|jgi:hypothetical protein|uniref:DUF6271 family protein n=1 Tax=Actinacidiphila sp. DG2A-62 TaxID=3108821 RepID=UPI002DB9C6DE|nr:DUF6271 family protein [Actinacidiphila sp. DG2A-62]MEC3995800.1 DUF6271 family protein [Actinacidiphila sp. DG2A-62]